MAQVTVSGSSLTVTLKNADRAASRILKQNAFVSPLVVLLPSIGKRHRYPSIVVSRVADTTTTTVTQNGTVTSDKTTVQGTKAANSRWCRSCVSRCFRSKAHLVVSMVHGRRQSHLSILRISWKGMKAAEAVKAKRLFVVDYHDIFMPYVARINEDYPYAADGLLVWDSIESWMKDYVSLYYSDSNAILEDLNELRAWWNEVVTKAHGDKKDASWWPKLDRKENLVRILTTIIWIASGHHAAVNFGQYDYTGFNAILVILTYFSMPNRV